jgi:hypothetical protein
MARHRLSSRDRAAFGELPPDFYIVPGPWPRLGRPIKHDVESWRVIDDWPARVPVTDAEIDVFEACSAIFSMNYSVRVDEVRRHLR